MRKIVSCNVRSLNNHKTFYTLEKYLSSNICIANLQETWHPKSSVKIKEYNEHIQTRTGEISSKTGGGGIGHYSHKSMKTVPTTLNLNKKDYIEMYAYRFERYIIVNVYRPPGCKSDDSLFTHIDQSISNLMSTYNDSYIIMLGDFNIDLLKDSIQKSKLLTIMDGLGLSQLVKSPTRHGLHKSSILDHCWTNDLDLTCNVFDLHIADHLAIEINLENRPFLDSVTTLRNITSENTEQLGVHLNNIDNELGNMLFDKYINTIASNINKFCPNIEIKNCPRKKQFKPDERYKELVRECEKLQNRFNQTSSINVRRQYNKIRNAKNRHVEKLIMNENNKLLNSAYGNKKNIWPIIDKLTGEVRSKQTDNVSIEVNGKKLSDTEAANVFARHFRDVPILTANTINYVPYNDNHIPMSRTRFNTFNHITEERLDHIVKNIDSKSSTGIDDLSMKLLKNLIPYIKNSLIKQLNKVIDSGCVPEILKCAKVIPLFKKGDKNDLNNYRPISLSIAISKILEKSMNLDIIEHIENTLDDKQFGFTKMKGTIDALTEILETVEETKQAKKQVGSLFLDISKAFDTVNKDILLSKLYKMGFEGNALQLLKSYLEERTMQVQIGGARSDPVSISQGVPQGSILGPTLFLVYINDLPSFMGKEADIVMFADDTTITVTGDCESTLSRNLEAVLGKAKVWFDMNKLALNERKTRVIHYYSDSNLNIRVNGQQIEQIGNKNNEKCFKLLGVEIDLT